MAHAYGITPTFWIIKGLTVGCQYKKGLKASKEWQNLTGCDTAIPVQQSGQTGSPCAHWDESCLQSELMTSILAINGNELSRMTIAAMEDFGYLVDYSAADEFGIEKVNATCLEELCGISSTGRRGDQRPVSEDSPSRRAAIQYGQELLQFRRRNKPQTESDSELVYMADQVVMILYRDSEDGRAHSVAVTP